MPWCPNCKTEYRFGISNCSDCKSPLVDELPMEEDKVDLVQYEAEKKETAEKLLAFLLNENILGTVLVEGEENSYKIQVEKSQLKRAEKIFAVFSKIEAENEFTVLDEEEKQKKIEESLVKMEKQKNTHVYTKASDRYKDNISTAWTFLVVGILGILFVILNYLGFLNLMSGPLQYIVSFIMFCAFIGVGLFSFSKRKHFQSLVEKEENAELEYKDWLRNLPFSSLSELWNKELSPEENEIVLINHLSEILVKNFHGMNENFADTLADEYFNEIRDKFL